MRIYPELEFQGDPQMANGFCKGRHDDFSGLFVWAIPPQTEYANACRNQDTNFELMALHLSKIQDNIYYLPDAKTLLGYRFLVVQIHGCVWIVCARIAKFYLLIDAFHMNVKAIRCILEYLVVLIKNSLWEQLKNIKTYKHKDREQ
jgi:hypothetical protein